MDVEASSTEGGIRGSNSVMNPYSGVAQPTESIWHHVRSFQRGLYMGLCLYGLHHYGVYNEIMASPKVSHEWFKVALSASIGLLFVKGYVEMYAGKFQKRRVSYENFPQSTHSAILLIILSSVSYHVALWPVYGGTTLLVMFLMAVFLLNFCLLFPTYIQNLAAVLVLVFFLQEYK